MNKIYNVINSHFSLKKIRAFLVILFLLGLVVAFLGNEITSRNEPGENLKNASVDNYDDNKKSNSLEEKLEKILSRVNGVGRVKVFISYETTDEKLALKDNDANGGEKTILYGTSRNEPFIYKSISPEIGGVIIVADGGSDAETKKAISDAVSTVLGISLHKVKVLKME